MAPAPFNLGGSFSSPCNHTPIEPLRLCDLTSASPIGRSTSVPRQFCHCAFRTAAGQHGAGPPPPGGPAASPGQLPAPPAAVRPRQVRHAHHSVVPWPGPLRESRCVATAAAATGQAGMHRSCTLAWPAGMTRLPTSAHKTCCLLTGQSFPPLAASGINFNFHLFGNTKAKKTPPVMIMGLGTTQDGWTPGGRRPSGPARPGPTATPTKKPPRPTAPTSPWRASGACA